MKTLGIDIGSRNTKIVIFDHDANQIAFRDWISTEVSAEDSVNKLLSHAEKQISLDEISSTCVTGYGRKLYKKADKIRSEISCHAKACHFLYPNTRTVIDIGGQDSKIIALNEDGSVNDFVMNDKCAAGTGRFLEMTAIKLECELSELSRLASMAENHIHLNSTCVVFAESEIIGLLASGHKVPDIARAINMSIARRIYTQMSSIELKEAVIFTGGVAQGTDLVNCLANLLKTQILVPFDPEITGALGAALYAL
nr:(R)-2-hydroxyacyl-CoA dehydratese activating ATPase [Candidatus Cloacimonadota bacterium]